MPKNGGKWRVCIDFTNLNEACPKDSFPLPHIDQIVDATLRHKILSFMDAFLGYNQIPMYPLDSKNTVFMTPFGTFYYNVMPFGLKNTRATYQRLVTKIFYPMLGKIVKVYIYEILVKNGKQEDQCADYSNKGNTRTTISSK